MSSSNSKRKAKHTRKREAEALRRGIKILYYREKSVYKAKMKVKAGKKENRRKRDGKSK